LDDEEEDPILGGELSTLSLIGTCLSSRERPLPQQLILIPNWSKI
jgi:hypothetical protein